MSRVKIFALVLLTIAMLASCSTTDEKLRAMIPDDAVGVIAVDVPSLIKKGRMAAGEDAVKLPDGLKKLIDEADPTIFGDVIGSLETSGIDFKSRSYLFFSPGIYKAVALIPVVDVDKASAMVAKIASGKMKDVDGVDFATHLDYAYAIDGNVLLIGRYNTPVSADVAAKAANDILNRTKPPILENGEISKYIDEKGEITAYINIKGLGAILKENSRFSTFLGNLPALDIVVDSDIKAMTLQVDFDMSKTEGESAKIKTGFLYDENGQYSKLYDKLINSAIDSTSNVLGLVPGELDTYFAIKINGFQLAQMPQMEKMFQLLETAPLTHGIKHKEMLSAINGTFVFGVAKGQVGDYNFAVATQSPNPDFVIDQIIEIGNLRGQSPYKSEGEYFYDYGSQGIAMGQTNNVFYLRCVDFETQYSAAELPVLPAYLENAAMALYQCLKIGNNVEGYLNWKLNDKSGGEGLYFTANEKDNVVISMLKCLCWKEPNSIMQEGEDNFDYGF